MTQTWPQMSALFRTTFESAPFGMALVSARPGEVGRILDVNPALCAITGNPAEYLRTVDFHALTHPDDVEECLALPEGSAEANLPGFDLERRYLHAQGHPMWLRLSGSLIADQDGAGGCFLTQALDVTESRRTAEALRAREQQLAQAQQLARLGSWEWEVATNRVTWSDELYRLFGVERNSFEATFEAFLAFVHPDHRQLVHDAVGRALATDETYALDMDVVRPDGSIRTCRTLGRVVRDADGDRW